MSSALLIDDDLELLASVKRAATAHGLDLLTASTWDEGLGLFHVLSPNLVIADYNMPGSRHGLKLLARIRRLRPGVRLILVSGYLDEDDMVRVRESHLVDDALTKGDAVQTAESILDEVKRAQSEAPRPTDWVEVAEAAIRASKVDGTELDGLDDLLRVKAENPDT